VKVRPVDDDAVARIQAFGDALGVEDPIVQGCLRQTDDGRCAFLDGLNACQIHRTYGAQAKPMICQQYPLVLLRTESGTRTGIDPGCYSAYATRDGPPVEIADSMMWSEVHYDAPTQRMEAALAALLTHPERRYDQVIRALAGAPGNGLPSGFGERLVQVLSQEAIAIASAHPSAGPSVRGGLAPVLAALPRWRAEGPPSREVPEALQLWGLDVAHRTVWLRLCPRMPSPMIAALLSLCGTLVAHWISDGKEDPFVHTHAAWSRAMRSPMFWGRIFPDPDAVSWLLLGDPRPP